jgi:hypothetical protein
MTSSEFEPATLRLVAQCLNNNNWHVSLFSLNPDFFFLQKSLEGAMLGLPLPPSGAASTNRPAVCQISLPRSALERIKEHTERSKNIAEICGQSLQPLAGPKCAGPKYRAAWRSSCRNVLIQLPWGRLQILSFRGLWGSHFCL